MGDLDKQDQSVYTSIFVLYSKIFGNAPKTLIVFKLDLKYQLIKILHIIIEKVHSTIRCHTC